MGKPNAIERLVVVAVVAVLSLSGLPTSTGQEDPEPTTQTTGSSTEPEPIPDPSSEAGDGAPETSSDDPTGTIGIVEDVPEVILSEDDGWLFFGVLEPVEDGFILTVAEPEATTTSAEVPSSDDALDFSGVAPSTVSSTESAEEFCSQLLDTLQGPCEAVCEVPSGGCEEPVLGLDCDRDGQTDTPEECVCAFFEGGECEPGDPCTTGPALVATVCGLVGPCLDGSGSCVPPLPCGSVPGDTDGDCVPDDPCADVPCPTQCPPPTTGEFPVCVPEIGPQPCPPGTSGEFPVCLPDVNCGEDANGNGIGDNCDPCAQGFCDTQCPPGTSGDFPVCLPGIETICGDDNDGNGIGDECDPCPGGDCNVDPCTDPLMAEACAAITACVNRVLDGGDEAAGVTSSDACPIPDGVDCNDDGVPDDPLSCIPDPAECLPPTPTSSGGSTGILPIARYVEILYGLREQELTQQTLADLALTADGQFALRTIRNLLAEGYPRPGNASEAAMDQWIVDLVGSAGLNAASVEEVPSGVLGYIALSAGPIGPQTPWHSAGFGDYWLSLVTERFETLSQELLAAIISGPHDENGWPTWENIQATSGMRQERLSLYPAVLYLATYRANAAGVLGLVIEDLMIDSLGFGLDLSLAMKSMSASASACGQVQDVYAAVLALVETVTELVATIPGMFFEAFNDTWEVFAGQWYDNLMVVSGLVATLAQNPVLPLADGALNQATGPGGDMFGPYHGAYIVGQGLVTSGRSALPQGGAATDEGGNGKWDVEITAFEGAATDYSWNVPVAGLQMDKGAKLSAPESATIFEEDGTIWQLTAMEYVFILSESQEPHWVTQDAEWSTAKCNTVQLLIVAGAVATMAAGAAATGPGAPVVFAAAVVVAGTTGVASSVAASDQCTEHQVWDEGFYYETGTHHNFWGRFEWFGAGQSIAGGLVTIVGSASQAVPIQHMESHPYSNGGDTRGYEHGLESAGLARADSREAAKADLPQFRSIASAAGFGQLSFEFLCQGLGETFEVNPEFEGRHPFGTDSEICLRVILGASSTGYIAGEGYGVIHMTTDGAGQGWVDVEGHRQEVPATLNLHAEGVNVHGN